MTMVTPATSASVLPSASNKMTAAVKQLEKADNLLRKHGWLLSAVDFARLQKGYNDLSADVAYTQLDPDEAFRFWNAVANMVTAARAEQISVLVKRKIDGWRSRYGETFDKTAVAVNAVRWQMCIAYSKNRQETQDLIDRGWNLLKIQLDSPWGKCKCGNKIIPVWATDKEKQEKFWWVPKICFDCHKAEVQAKKNAQPVIEFVSRPVVHDAMFDPAPAVAAKPKAKKAVKKPVKAAKPKAEKVIEIVASEKVKTEGKKPRGKPAGRKMAEGK